MDYCGKAQLFFGELINVFWRQKRGLAAILTEKRPASAWINIIKINALTLVLFLWC